MTQDTLVAECDLGRDYEHCLELQKKVNDTETVSLTHLMASTVSNNSLVSSPYRYPMPTVDSVVQQLV